MITKTYKFPIPEEMVTPLQKLDYEISTASFIVERLFDTHKGDADTSLFDSVPFKAYIKKIEEARYAYDQEKQKLTDYLIPLIKEKENDENVNFNWNLENFAIPEVRIDIIA